MICRKIDWTGVTFALVLLASIDVSLRRLSPGAERRDQPQKRRGLLEKLHADFPLSFQSKSRPARSPVPRYRRIVHLFEIPPRGDFVSVTYPTFPKLPFYWSTVDTVHRSSSVSARSRKLGKRVKAWAAAGFEN